MSTVESSKINLLLASLPKEIVLLASWLTDRGYSPDLQKRYRKSGWLTSIGRGAMIRSGDKVGYLGAIYALQTQARMTIHPGAKTALAMQGKAHYLEMGESVVMLFGDEKERLPAWFNCYSRERIINFHSTSFLPAGMALTEYSTTHFSIKISNPARAMMECLYLSPHRLDLLECYKLMEGLNNLRPDQVITLMKVCTSVKVKRLFLYLADKAGHSWLKHLNIRDLDLGTGKRSIVKGGVYVPKFQITVPRELEANDKSNV